MVIMMCQCRFISCNKCTTLREDVDNREVAVYEVGGIWEISILLLDVAVDLKLL